VGETGEPPTSKSDENEQVSNQAVDFEQGASAVTPHRKNDSTSGNELQYTAPEATSSGTTDPDATTGATEGEGTSPLDRIEEYLTGYGYLVIGVVAMLFAAGFMLKLAYERDWLGAVLTDTHKIIAGTVVGLLLIGAGEYLVRMGRSYFARGIFGLALGWLYFIFYVGLHYFDVFSQNMAGGYMIAVTATGVALSVRHRSRLIAHLSFIGGFLTPWFISTGSASTLPLFLYVTALITGFLCLSIRRNWPGLDVTAQIGTFSIFFSWYANYFSTDQFYLAAVFFWIFYGLLLTSVFIKYRRWASAVPSASSDDDATGAPLLMSVPYTLLPVAGLVLLFLIHVESLRHLHDGAGLSISVLGASFFLSSSFLTRGTVPNGRVLQYLIGLAIFTSGLLLHLGTSSHPEWLVAPVLAVLYLFYHAIRLWQSASYYWNAVPRMAISLSVYVTFLCWFQYEPPGSDVVLPLCCFSALFLVDHLTASYRFLFYGKSLSFPVHYGANALLFLGGGALLLSGLVPGTPAEIQAYFPWFCYTFSGFYLLEHTLLIRGHNRRVRYLVQSILVLALVIAPIFQAQELQQSLSRILPVSGLFFVGYQAMLFQIDVERDWFIGGVGFLGIGFVLFDSHFTAIELWVLQAYGWVLFLSFLRIPHLIMARGTNAVEQRDVPSAMLFIAGFFLVLQMLTPEHPAVARYSSWAITYLCLGLGYQLLYTSVVPFLRTYTSIGLALGVFAHLHLLLRETIHAPESWALLFPFLIVILFTGEYLEANASDDPDSSSVPIHAPNVSYLYAVPAFAYSLFFTDLVFSHNPSIAPGSVDGYFQQPILHEMMLTFVTALVGAGPIWKKIRWNQNITRHGITLFQSTLLLFYVASFYVADEFQGARDWFIPVLLAPVMFTGAWAMSAHWYDDQKQKLLYLVNGFLMTTHGILIAFDHQYQTLFLGIDAAVFFTLARMYRWKWIAQGSLLAAGWLGLHLCWSSYEIQSGQPGTGITLDFMVRFAGLLALLVIPYAAQRFRDRDQLEWPVSIEPLVIMSVALLSLYLGNLKIISYFGWYEPEIRQHMNAFMYALSALWGGAGLVYFLSGFLMNYRFLRLFGSLLILITTVKVFFFDLNVEMIWRVLSFFTLGCVLLIINYIYRSSLDPYRSD
jgi:uncharacterized membrane protein